MDIISDAVFSSQTLPRTDAKFETCVLNGVELRRTLDNPDVVGQNNSGVKLSLRGITSAVVKWFLRQANIRPSMAVPDVEARASGATLDGCLGRYCALALAIIMRRIDVSGMMMLVRQYNARYSPLPRRRVATFRRRCHCA